MRRFLRNCTSTRKADTATDFAAPNFPSPRGQSWRKPGCTRFTFSEREPLDLLLGLVNPVPDHRNRPLRRQRRTFLPADDVAAMVAGKINPVVRNNEFSVGTVVVGVFVRGWIIRTTADPRPEDIRHLAPGNVHRLLQFPALAWMQFFDRRSGSRKLGFIRRQLAEITKVFHGVTGDQYSAF